MNQSIRVLRKSLENFQRKCAAVFDRQRIIRKRADFQQPIRAVEHTRAGVQRRGYLAASHECGTPWSARPWDGQPQDSVELWQNVDTIPLTLSSIHSVSPLSLLARQGQPRFTRVISTLPSARQINASVVS